MYVTLLINMVI